MPRWLVHGRGCLQRRELQTRRVGVQGRQFTPLLSPRPHSCHPERSEGSAPCPARDPKLALRMTAVRKFTPLGARLGRDKSGPYTLPAGNVDTWLGSSTLTF